MQKMSRYLAWASILGLATLIPSISAKSQYSASYYLNQYLNALKGFDDPATAKRRVTSIWADLRDYSGQTYSVIPSQNFNVGMGTPNGIYLDVSVAADPSIEVTRFFLAHEWGHMIHGDPLRGLIAGFYRFPFADSTSAEDSADEYAAKFMRDRGYDIRPAMNFLCGAPDGGPQDTHSPGVDRAANIARIYGYDNSLDACGDSNGDGSLLATEIKMIINGSLNHYSRIRKQYAIGGHTEYRLTVPITIDGRDVICDAEDTEFVVCRGLRPEGADDDADFDLIASAVEKGSPATWKRIIGDDTGEEVDTHVRVWRRDIDDYEKGEIELEVTPKHIKLSIQAPKS